VFIEIFPRPPQRLITWFAYGESNGRCRVRDFLSELERKQKVQWHKLIGRMKAFADNGWGPRTNFMKALTQTFSPHTIYEIKSHQERVLFVRCESNAVAVDALQKKDEWSKKDNDRLVAAARLADAAMAQCKGGNRR
jgi:hypothetical protein